MPKGVPRDQSIQHAVITRLKIAQGQLTKVIEMTERGHYCIDVINQSYAVENAIKQAIALLLQNHVNTCVRDQVKNGHIDEATVELMKIFEKH